MKTLVLCAAVLLFPSQGGARGIYVSTTGSDTTNTGTIDRPFRTIPKGISTAAAGDTIYLRGGTYGLSSTLSISKSGTSGSRYYLFAFPAEHPVLDFSAEVFGSRGINLTGSYWYIKGLDIYKAGDNGIHVSGSNNIIELCTLRENADTGLQLDNGASNNSIINCDSYFNVDPGQENADGFSPKLTVGSGNYFYGCRSWQNSDDGWDGYMRGANNVTTTLENCWTFMNGYLKNGSPSTGDGNGFKMGGSDNRDLEHNMILKKCLAFDNRVKGFDQNNNRGSMALYNCTGYHNGTNYSIALPLDSGKTLEVKNCVALGAYGSLGSFAIQATNSWSAPFIVTSADFVSIDTTGVRGPRKADGSLPDVPFMHLAQGSDLINAGTNVGLPYNGSGPDLGCFESQDPTSVNRGELTVQAFRLYQNYPNPFNPTTIISYSIPKSGNVVVRIFNTLGEVVSTLLDLEQEAGSHAVRWDGANERTHAVSTGIYLCVVRFDGARRVQKMMLIK